MSCLRGTTSELLRERACGVVYELGDALSLCASLGELARDRPRLSRLARSARAACGEKYSADKVYERPVRYLVDVAASRACATAWRRPAGRGACLAWAA